MVKKMVVGDHVKPRGSGNGGKMKEAPRETGAPPWEPNKGLGSKGKIGSIGREIKRKGFCF